MTVTVPPVAAPAPTAHATPPLTRLTIVELRKMTDTRAGFWLLAVTLFLAVAVLVAMLIWAPEDELSLQEMTAGAVGMSGLLLPVLGVLAITSEWSQRTALTTFSLVPRRGRVVTAKVIACVVLALAATLVGLQLAVLAHLIGGNDWNLSLGELGTLAILQVLSLLGGFAIGLVLLRSAPAIVVAYLLPTMFAILGETIPGFRDTADWLDTSVPGAELTEDAGDGEAWAQLLTSWSLWLGLPMVLGLLRLRRAEVS